MISPFIIQTDPKPNSSVITRNALARDMEGRAKGHVKQRQHLLLSGIQIIDVFI